MSNFFKVVLMAMMPVIELRGSLPIAVGMGYSNMEALFISLFASMIPVPFILLLFRPITEAMRRTEIFSKLVNKIIARTMKNEEKIKKYGLLGLVIIVAIPLPGTGVWTGSFLASLLHLRLSDSIFAIFLGDLIAGIIVLTITYGIGSFL